MSTERNQNQPAIHRFAQAPATYVDRSRLQQCLGPEFSEATTLRFLQNRRLSGKISNLLLEHFALEALADEDDYANISHAALLSFKDLKAASVLVGAGWHGRSFRFFILKAAAQDLASRIGEKAHAYALANPNLAISDSNLTSIESLTDAVHSTARNCLVAWLHSLPSKTASRVLLKIPLQYDLDQNGLTEQERIMGPDAIERAAKEFDLDFG